MKLPMYLDLKVLLSKGLLMLQIEGEELSEGVEVDEEASSDLRMEMKI